MTAPLVLLLYVYTSVRLMLYRFVIRRRQPGFPSIIIGSVFVGGSGKTPLTHYFAVECFRRGLYPVVVSGGYRKRTKGVTVVSDGYRLLADVESAGDEAYMMALKFLEESLRIPVISGRDRLEAIRQIHGHFPCDLVLLDDGLQFLKLKAHAEIATLDHSQFRNRFLFLPWGYMRDTFRRIRYPHALVITKIPDGQTSGETARARTGSLIRTETVLDSLYNPYYLKECFSRRRIDPQELTGKKAVAFSGLGHNPSFTGMMKEVTNRLHAELIDFIGFNDHHRYTEKDCRRIIRSYPDDPDTIWVTTEKDAVKLHPEWFPENIRPKIWVLVSRIEIPGFSPWLDSLLSRLLSDSCSTPHSPTGTTPS